MTSQEYSDALALEPVLWDIIATIAMPTVFCDAIVQGVVARLPDNSIEPQLARHAYDIADAMMAERRRRLAARREASAS